MLFTTLFFPSNIAGGPNSTESSMKAARAALMLFPILGINFIFLPIRPKQGSTLEYVYTVISAVSSSYQVSDAICYACINCTFRMTTQIFNAGVHCSKETSCFFAIYRRRTELWAKEQRLLAQLIGARCT